jgi:hypothetical protein
VKKKKACVVDIRMTYRVHEWTYPVPTDWEV